MAYPWITSWKDAFPSSPALDMTHTGWQNKTEEGPGGKFRTRSDQKVQSALSGLSILNIHLLVKHRVKREHGRIVEIVIHLAGKVACAAPQRNIRALICTQQLETTSSIVSVPARVVNDGMMLCMLKKWNHTGLDYFTVIKSQI